MKRKQSTISREPTSEEAKIFCDVCQNVYESRVTYRNIFDDLSSLPQSEKKVPEQDFIDTPIGSCLRTISHNLVDNVLMEIARLHDPASFRQNENLSIDILVNHVVWSTEEHPRIKSLEKKLNKFFVR